MVVAVALGEGDHHMYGETLRDEVQVKANARLIAQAPSLLEAAKAAVRGQVINNWATAGEWVCRNCGEMPGEHAHDEGCWVALCNAAISAAEGVE